jgi:hypothetical protein
MSDPAKKNTAYNFSVGLPNATNGKLLANPTIVAGDVTISVDHGAFVNLTNLPTSNPPGSRSVEISLTAAEMNGDDIVIIFSDPDYEWNDVFINIKPNARTIDELMYPTYQLPDSVATDGVIPTFEQAIYMIAQFLFERQVTGTTVAVKKVDGTTTLMTFTLNSPTTPTSITRA